MIIYIIMAVVAYLIGSISFSVIISKKVAGIDVRNEGSKNAGTTNVLRTVGKRAAALTLIGDISKGLVAVLIGYIIGLFAKNNNPAILVEIAGLFVVLGHMFPIFFDLKGGKGVATSLGILLLMNWKIGLICIIFGVILIAITRMVSLGSISGAILFFILTIFINDGYIVEYNATFILFGAILCAIVVFNHRANLKRIINGNENKLSFKKKEESTEDTDDNNDENDVEE